MSEFTHQYGLWKSFRLRVLDLFLSIAYDLSSIASHIKYLQAVKNSPSPLPCASIFHFLKFRGIKASLSSASTRSRSKLRNINEASEASGRVDKISIHSNRQSCNSNNVLARTMHDLLSTSDDSKPSFTTFYHRLTVR